MDNMRDSLLSDGVDDALMAALADGFEGMPFLGPGRVLIGELNEDAGTTKLIVGLRQAETDKRKKATEHHAMQTWNTNAVNGIDIQAPDQGTYTLIAVLAIFEHWNTL